MPHHAIGIALLVFLIAYAFGKETAQKLVAGALILGALAILYVAYRVVTGTI